MKRFNSSVLELAVVIATMAGCAVVPVQQPMSMRAPSATMFGSGRFPIPGRPPAPYYIGQAEVEAPFSDNYFFITVKNSVEAGIDRKPLIITRLWVAGVEVPIMHAVRMYDHVFPVRFLLVGGVQKVGLPPSQFLDGSGEGKVHVRAQASSWRYDLLGHIVPSNNVKCIEDTIRVGETEVLDWNHRMEGVIACPEQGIAAK